MRLNSSFGRLKIFKSVHTCRGILYTNVTKPIHNACIVVSIGEIT